MADIELLPLPPHFSHQHDNVKKIVREYAIANMTELMEDRGYLLARLDASIDHATKLGIAQQRCLDEVLELKARAERLTEALRDAAEALQVAGLPGNAKHFRSILRDHGQEVAGEE